MNTANTFRAIAIGSMITILSATGVFAGDQAECTPSQWGPDDEIGAANLVTPERTLQALKVVKKGISHPLGIVIDHDTPAFAPRSMNVQVVTPGQHNGRSLEGDFGWDITYNDDLAQLWFGIGSQLDGFGHLGEGGMYYNCNHARDFVNISGLSKLGTHNIPPIVARGVLIDMAKHQGVDALAAAAVGRGIDDLHPAFQQADFACLHQAIERERGTGLALAPAAVAAMHEQRRTVHAVADCVTGAAAFEAGFIWHLCSQQAKNHGLRTESIYHREMIVLFLIFNGEGSFQSRQSVEKTQVHKHGILTFLG